MHMPGHKRRMEGFCNPYFIDITEIDGFDNLHHAKGILLEAQERAARLYRSKETHYLVGGSTAGILSAVCGCTRQGGKLIMARNCHKSVYHAASIMNLKTVYIYPQIEDNLGINGRIFPDDVEKFCQLHPDAQAVLITSPTYDGVVSDVRKIARIAHSHGIPLIVDEAHGAHFPFSDDFPEDSVRCGADVVIHSLHKTLPALTQTALIHINGDLVDKERIRRYLTMYQSSSPSYVLMASIDHCIRWVGDHPEAFAEFSENLRHFRERLSGMKHLRLLEAPGMDKSKILISASGMSGHALSDLLRREYRIELEMACQTYVCGIATVCDTKKSLERFREALEEIDERSEGCQARPQKNRSDIILPARQMMSIRSAMDRQQEWTDLCGAEGRISGDFVTLYPPGIPILAPGEQITGEILQRLRHCLKDGLEVHGITGHRILVLK